MIAFGLTAIEKHKIVGSWPMAIGEDEEKTGTFHMGFDERKWWENWPANKLNRRKTDQDIPL